MKDINFEEDRVLILDPTSPETNRGSFCYLSYLIYSYALSLETSYTILEEEFRVSDMDRISHLLPNMDHILIALWSYPQIETCLMLNRMLKGKCRFFGYYPLIEKLGLAPAYYTEEIILKGMESYPDAYSHFEHLLLSDCDMHIKLDDGSTPQVYPLFTNYGCPKRCAFCPATKNQSKRLILDEDTVFRMLENCARRNIHHIHFTDEDFFFNAKRAFKILKYGAVLGFEFIALGSIESVNKFMHYMKGKEIWEQNAVYGALHLVEIGLETASTKHLVEDLGKKRTMYSAEKLAQEFPAKILWLTMTFGPGETISSIAETGKFLRKYGLNPADMEERLVTNGTEGGLGQFFQLYDGTMNEQSCEGWHITPRPMRLLPSYIPDSFLDCEFEMNLELYCERNSELRYWMDIYGVLDTGNELFIKQGTLRVGDYAEGNVDAAICLALMARLGIIEEVA